MDIWKDYANRSDAILCHGTAVALDGRGCLILGPSGAGKSGVATQMLAMGCNLVADDRVWVVARDGQPWLEAPDPIAGQLEVRGLGVLTLPHIKSVPLDFAVDLSHSSVERLPTVRTHPIFGKEVRVLPRSDLGSLAAALKLVLINGPDCLD